MWRLKVRRRRFTDAAADAHVARSTVLAIVAVLLSLLCVGSAAGAKQRVAAKPVLRLGLSFDITNLDPARNVGGFSATNLAIAYAPIIYTKPDGSYGPGLATSWRYLLAARGSGQKNKNFELTFRRDARFSNGQRVTARAIKTWFEYVASLPTFTALGPNPKFTTVGEWVVRVRATVPNPEMARVFSSIGLLPTVAAPAAAANPALFTSGSYGAGPYMLDASRSVRGDHYTYIPNPHFYDKKLIRYRQVYVKVITNASSMLQALQAGQLDVAFGDPTTARGAEAAGFKVVSSALGTLALYLADSNGAVAKPLADPRVRQALNYAIDRKAIASALIGKYGVPTSQYLTSAFTDPKLEAYYPHNPARARSLLAAAGVGSGFTIKVITPTGITGETLVRAVASYWERVGVHVDVTVGASVADVIGKLRSQQYSAIPVQAGIRPPTEAFAQVIGPKAILNVFGISDPTLNRSYYKGLRATNPNRYWKDFYTRLTQQAWFVPVSTSPLLYYVRKGVGGVTSSNARIGYALPSEWYPTKS